MKNRSYKFQKLMNLYEFTVGLLLFVSQAEVFQFDKHFLKQPFFLCKHCSKVMNFNSVDSFESSTMPEVNYNLQETSHESQFFHHKTSINRCSRQRDGF